MDREGAETLYTYDAASQLTRVTDDLGYHVDYEYNNRGWLTNTLEIDPDGAGAIVREEKEMEYEDCGKSIERLVDRVRSRMGMTMTGAERVSLSFRRHPQSRSRHLDV